MGSWESTPAGTYAVDPDDNMGSRDRVNMCSMNTIPLVTGSHLDPENSENVIFDNMSGTSTDQVDHIGPRSNTSIDSDAHVDNPDEPEARPHAANYKNKRTYD